MVARGTGGGGGRPEEEDDDLTVGVFARVKGGDSRDPSIVVRRRYDVQQDMQVKNLEFSLDWVFDDDAVQEEVYQIVAERRVARILRGYNVCLLAYGQTGSGKTYTMFGPEAVLDDWKGSDPTLHGLAPRAIGALFEGLQARPAESRYVVTCSYVEVHNDACNDLLGGRKGLNLRETGERRVVVEGLTSEVVSSPQQVMEVLHRGNGNRMTAAMKMNARSSRSHAIFSLSLAQIGDGAGGAAADGSLEAGRLTLVDLAGMESSKKSSMVQEGATHSGRRQAQRREESRHINTSLYALGTVIERLSVSSRAAGGGAAVQQQHVPYRNSKLTRLLQESLGGNCAPAIVVTLRTEAENLDETIGTLRFAQRAKAIPVVVRPAQLEKLDAVKLEHDLALARDELVGARRIIERLTREVGMQHDEGTLEAQVRAIVSSLGGHPDVARIAQLEVENRQLRHRNRALRVTTVWQRLMALRHADLRARLERREREISAQLVTTSRELMQAQVEASRGGGC